MANQNLSQFGEKLFVADADHTFIWDSAASISKRVSRNSWMSAGSIATSTPLTISQTWTDAAVAFAAMKIVATDTNSAAGSDFLELYSGTATQPLRLDIQKTGQLNIYGTWSNSTSYERLSFSAPTAANAIIGTNKGSGGGTARGLDLHTDGAARMTITTAGNVGIGTTAPGTKLEVAGTFYFGSNNGALPGYASYGGNIGASRYFFITGTSVDNTTIYLQNNSSGSKNAMVRLLGSGSGADYGALQMLTIESSPVIFATNATEEKMRITSAGNVGIGTTSPSSKLEVYLNSANNYTTEKVNFGNIHFANGTGGYSNLWMGSISTPLTLSASNYTLANDGTNTIINGGSGGLYFHVGAAAHWNIQSTGHLLCASDNSRDIGAVNSQRPRNVYVGSDVHASVLRAGIWVLNPSGVVHGTIRSESDGVFRLTDSAINNFNRLQFGNTSASFPAIKRVGAEFQVVIASSTAAINVAAPDADLTFIEDRYRRKGAGTPEGVVTAPIGAVYHNTTGGAGTSFYVKESGTGNTGWVGK